ncbi:hypothetical protein Tco_0123470, partial [Tanacetum coccineum]
ARAIEKKVRKIEFGTKFGMAPEFSGVPEALAPTTEWCAILFSRAKAWRQPMAPPFPPLLCSNFMIGMADFKEECKAIGDDLCPHTPNNLTCYEDLCKEYWCLENIPPGTTVAYAGCRGAKDMDLRLLSGWADELDLVLNQSGALVGQGSALIACLRIRTLFRRRPTEAARARLVVPEPCRCKMDLFTFIRHSDPTKVRVGERNLADREVKLLKMTEGRTVALDPLATAVSRSSSDNIDCLFDDGDDVGQEHSTERDGVQEEVIAKDASGVVVEKLQKKRKRKVIGDASGSALPPKSDATRPAVTASVAPTPDIETVDSVSGLNFRTRPPHARYVISLDSSLHSDSYSEAASLVRSVADAPVVTVAVTTTIDANIAAGSKAKDAASLVRSAADAPVATVVVTTTIDANIAAGSKAKDVLREIEHTGDYASAGRPEADAVSISKLKKPSISSDSFYASQSLDTETLHHVYVPRWKVTNDYVLDDSYVCRDMTDRLAPPALFTQLRAMDYAHLYSEFNVGLRSRCAILLSERDTEIAHLKSLLSLKEAEATEAISLRGQLTVLKTADASKSAEMRALKEKNFALEGERNALCDRVEALESAAASKEVELTSLSSQVAKLTADLSGFQLSRDELNSKVASLESERDCLVTQRSSLESAFELFREQVEKMQDEQVGILIDHVAAIDSDLMEMALHMDAEFYPRYLTTIAGRRWLLNRGLKLVLSKCLSSPEYLSAMGEAIGRAIDKGMQDGLAAGIKHGVAGRNITDVAAYNPSAESDYVAAVNALQNVSFPLLAQLEAYKDASMADIMDLLPFSSADVTVTTALATTFAQTFPIPMGASMEVPLSPKIIFEEEELDTTSEHALAL